MENICLNSAEERYAFFNKIILNSLNYWLFQLKNATFTPYLPGSEQESVVKAIMFALDLKTTWRSVYELIIIFSPHIERRGRWITWSAVLSRAIKMAQKVGDTENEANLSALLGLMLQRQSRFTEAIFQHRHTIRVAKRARNHSALARAYTNLGAIYTRQGYWYRAEVVCCRALRLFEQAKNNYGRAHTENHLGLLYMRQHRFKAARQHFEQAQTIWQANGDERGMLKILINFSALCIKQERPEQTLAYLQQAQQQAGQIEDKTEIGLIYLNKGIAYRLKKDLIQAETCYRQAEVIANRFSNLQELAFIWDSLGVVYIHQKKWQQADFYLKKAFTAWQELGSITGQINTLFNLIDYAEAREDHRQAITYLRTTEALFKHPVQNSSSQHFYSQLEQYRRSLKA